MEDDVLQPAKRRIMSSLNPAVFINNITLTGDRLRPTRAARTKITLF